MEGPASGEVNANAMGGLAYTCTDFEELGTQGFDLGRAPGLRQVLAEEIDHIVRRHVEKKAKCIGQKAMAAQAIGVEAVFELLDAVVTLATIVVRKRRPGQRGRLRWSPRTAGWFRSHATAYCI